MAFLVGPGPIAAPGGFTSNPLSQTSPQPGANPPLGTKAVDNVGNVYILCDSLSTLFSALPVVINDDYTCQTVTTSQTTGRIGVNCANATSDQLVWVQIYGRCLMQVGGNNVSPSELLTTVRTSAAIKWTIPTSLSTPASLSNVTDASSLNAGEIVGMWVATDVTLGETSAVTSATSHTGSQVGVFLNYPFIRYAGSGVGDAS